MNGFFKSFEPILKKLKKFRIELFLLVIAFFIAIISLALYIYDNKGQVVKDESVQESVLSATSSRMVVDIAGAVERPGVYETIPGARLKDVLIQAGGLSQEAERKYIERNFNLAKLVTDQEKIYIPSQEEVSSGIFAEPQRLLDYTSPAQIQIQSSVISANEKININAATLEELDTLAGIGKITAEKIIQNRPYQNIQELVNRKVLNKGVFEKIKDLISI